jgi:hypothetical protein
MMAALGCLIKDTRLVQDIKEVLQIMAADAINGGKRFTLNNAYNFLRDNDIEVDLESVGSIYSDTFDLSDGNFNTADEIESLVGKSFEETLNNLVDMQPKATTEQIGTLSPGKQAARTIVGIFRSANVTDTKTQTLMRRFQDSLAKAAKRIVDKSALPDTVKTPERTFEQVLSDAFDLEQHGIRTISGTMNSVQDVWNEFQNEVQLYRNELKKNGMDAIDIATFDMYTQKLISTGYNIFLSQKEAQDVLKGALIESGYYRETQVKGETKKVLDWKKLAGIGGDITLMNKNVADVLRAKGFTDQQITRVNDLLAKEYVDLKASIIEKATNELKRRDNAGTNVQQKSASRRLAEMYTFGLFNATPGTYQNITNRLFGLSEIDQQTFSELQELGKALQTLYATSYQGQELDESHLRLHVQEINDKIDGVLTKYSNSKSRMLRIARVVQAYIEMGQRFILNNVRNLFQNRLSNWFALVDAKVGYLGNANKELKKYLKTVSKATYRDIHIHGGGSYGKGDTSTFINKGSIDRMFTTWTENINDPTKQAAMGRFVSFMVGREGLEAADSFYKSKITELYLIKNLVRLLTDKTNIDPDLKRPMTKKEAIQYISDNLTGQKFEDAKKVARDATMKINKEAGKKIVSDNEDAITRFANDIVKAQLVVGGKISEEFLSAAYNAAYHAAGRDLGHVANNWISKQMQKLTSSMEEDITKHIRNREYRSAAFNTLASMFFRNVMNPFVGGATNWIVLGLEKTGLGLITGGASMIRDPSTKIDIEEDTPKEIEKKLFDALKQKNKWLRGSIGGATSAFIWLMWRSMGGCNATTDDSGQRVPCGFEAWRKNNRWASRYTDLITPEVYLAELSLKSGNMLNYVQNYLGQDDKFSKMKMVKDVAELAGKGENHQAMGRLGDLVGSPLNFPVPWRPAKDIYTLGQGLTGGKPFSYDYTPSKGFLEGATRGGFLEWVGLNYRSKHYLEDLPGVGGKNLDRLKAAGINSVEDLKDRNLRAIKYQDSKGRNRSIWNEDQRGAVEQIIKNEYGDK